MRIIKRIQNTRLSYDYIVDDKVASNFYPINSLLSIRDTSNNRQISIYNDRPQGGSSLSNGEMFIVMNRWSKYDDNRGLSRPLYESNSSKANFHINHWMSLTKKEYDSYYLYDIINKQPIYVSYSSLSLFPFDKYNRYSRLRDIRQYEIFSIEDIGCIEYNYYFLNDKEVLIQFLNRIDPYVNENSSSTCKVKINKYSSIIKSIVNTSLNGIERGEIIGEGYIIDIRRLDFRSIIVIFN